MDRTNSGKYLLLVGSPDAPRALLFGNRHDYLAELDDDEFVIEDLMKAGAPCPPPEPLTRRLAREVDPAMARCYRLADW
ncbi:hypothetical protein M8A51_09270 [Schlegelella sp. S2-27]|uniref:Uncharacterized protein n=1 Tax=Caldimonas mangrovi TaxID=2944811 RepID=A0ABT0YMR3_9BURK|nr:hypothetical protein [Caldimonas mangrovi]MCM5679724.1 hypothetical protein [Caldimonas mangrovi]